MLLCFPICFRVFKKDSLIQENIYDGGAFLKLFLIAECNFDKKEIFYKLGPVNLPKMNTNETLQQLNLQGFK